MTDRKLNSPQKKSYCSQNRGDCLSCSLCNSGRDCRNILLMVPARLAEKIAVEPVKLSEAQFKSLMEKTQVFHNYGPSDYWTGVMRGLRRAFHGEAFGTPQEHEQWLLAAIDEDQSHRERRSITAYIEMAVQEKLERDNLKK